VFVPDLRPRRHPRCSGRTGRSSVSEVPESEKVPEFREEVIAPARTKLRRFS